MNTSKIADNLVNDNMQQSRAKWQENEQTTNKTKLAEKKMYNEWSYRKSFTFLYKCCILDIVIHMSTATRYAGYKTSGFTCLPLPDTRDIKRRGSHC